MSTIVTYGGVTLSNVQTRRYFEEVVYDESNTDATYHRVRVRVLGFIHTNYNATTVNVLPNGGVSVAANHIQVRRMLLEPRKNFTMTVGGFTLLTVGPNTGGAYTQYGGDVNNGPKPISCEITHIVGAAMLRVEFEIELAIIECADNTNTSGVLNNRWSVQDTLDRDFYTTRVYAGRLRIASADLNPNAFRNWVVPPLQGGFVREGIDVVASADGLTLDYTVTDREVYATPPAPGTTWEGTHSVVTDDGVTSHAELAIMIKGPKGADKALLIQAMAIIVQTKLGIGQGTGALIESAAMIDHLDDNVVEMRCRTLVNPGSYPLALSSGSFGSSSQPGVTLNMLGFGQPLDNVIPGYDSSIALVPLNYGSVGPVGLFVAALQSPCNGNHQIATTGAISPSGNQATYGDAAQVRAYTTAGKIPTDAMIDSNYTYGDSARVNIYTYYRIHSAYTTDATRTQMPVAVSNASASSGNQDTSAIITLARGVTSRRTHVEAERLGDWPKVPSAIDILGSDPKIYLMLAKKTPQGPQITADGVTKRYVIDLEYEHAFSRNPVEGQDALTVGSLPWLTSNISQDALPASAFVTGIVQ